VTEPYIIGFADGSCLTLYSLEIENKDLLGEIKRIFDNKMQKLANKTPVKAAKP
jgi:hypothetical protein